MVGEGVASEAGGGEGVVIVGVAIEGDGGVGGVAIPVLSVAVVVEDEGGGVCGDLVGLAIERTAEKVYDLGGGVGCGRVGVHGEPDVETWRLGEGESGGEAEVAAGDVEVVAEAGVGSDGLGVGAGGPEFGLGGAGLDQVDEHEGDTTDSRFEAALRVHGFVFVPDGFEKILGKGDLVSVEGHGGGVCGDKDWQGSRGDLLREAGAEGASDDAGDEVGGGAALEVCGGFEIGQEGGVLDHQVGGLDVDGAVNGAFAGEGMRGHGLDGGMGSWFVVLRSWLRAARAFIDGSLFCGKAAGTGGGVQWAEGDKGEVVWATADDAGRPLLGGDARASWKDDLDATVAWNAEDGCAALGAEGVAVIGARAIHGLDGVRFLERLRDDFSISFHSKRDL